MILSTVFLISKINTFRHDVTDFSGNTKSTGDVHVILHDWDAPEIETYSSISFFMISIPVAVLL